MQPLEAWNIISKDMAELYMLRQKMYPNMKHYSDSETEAEVLVFGALKQMEERELRLKNDKKAI